MSRSILIAAGLTAVLGAFALAPPLASAAERAPAAATANLRLSGGYVRGLPTAQRVTSAYFELHNTSATTQRLVGASSDQADSVEIHAHEMRDGMARMRKREFVDVPAGGSVRFAPGGLHLMLFGLRSALVDRTPIALRLRFADGSALAASIPVCSVMRPRCP